MSEPKVIDLVEEIGKDYTKSVISFANQKAISKLKDRLELSEYDYKILLAIARELEEDDND